MGCLSPEGPCVRHQPVLRQRKRGDFRVHEGCHAHLQLVFDGRGVVFVLFIINWSLIEKGCHNYITDP